MATDSNNVFFSFFYLFAFAKIKLLTDFNFFASFISKRRVRPWADSSSLFS